MTLFQISKLCPKVLTLNIFGFLSHIFDKIYRHLWWL
jgi:hypothetical protein